MGVFGIYLQQEAFLPPIYQLLLQQDNIHGQVHENPWKLIVHHYSDTETPSLQMLHPPYCSVQFLIVVLQSCSSFVPTKNPKQNAEKSYHLDTRCFQDVSFGRY